MNFNHLLPKKRIRMTCKENNEDDVNDDDNDVNDDEGDGNDANGAW